jgi:hypothetical protein
MAAFEAARFNHSRTSPRRVENVVAIILAGVSFRKVSSARVKVREHQLISKMFRLGAISTSHANNSQIKAPPFPTVLS